LRGEITAAKIPAAAWTTQEWLHFLKTVQDEVSVPTSREGDRVKAADRMVELASQQPGFLGVESVRGTDGLGLTVSYWSSPEAIVAWKANAEHRLAQASGHRKWYEHFESRVARVERAYSGPRSS